MQMEQIRRDIRDFKEKSGVDKVIVLWTANTERFIDIVTGVNDTAKNLLATIQVIHRQIISNISTHLHAHYRNRMSHFRLQMSGMNHIIAKKVYNHQVTLVKTLSLSL